MTLIFPVTWCCVHGKHELKMLDEDGWTELSSSCELYQNIIKVIWVWWR